MEASPPNKQRTHTGTGSVDNGVYDLHLHPRHHAACVGRRLFPFCRLDDLGLLGLQIVRVVGAANPHDLVPAGTTTRRAASRFVGESLLCEELLFTYSKHEG